jgi:hypothetical protein
MAVFPLLRSGQGQALTVVNAADAYVLRITRMENDVEAMAITAAAQLSNCSSFLKRV